MRTRILNEHAVNTQVFSPHLDDMEIVAAIVSLRCQEETGDRKSPRPLMCRSKRERAFEEGSLLPRSASRRLPQGWLVLVDETLMYPIDQPVKIMVVIWAMSAGGHSIGDGQAEKRTLDRGHWAHSDHTGPPAEGRANAVVWVLLRLSDPTRVLLRCGNSSIR